MDHLELASLMTKQWMVWTEAGVEIFPVGGGDRIAFLVGSDAKEQADRIVQAHNASLSTAVEPTTNPKRYTMEVLLPDYRVEPEETSDGEWVRYEDIKHLPQDEPGADVPIKRCCCGEKEWPPDAIKIEDARGVLHFAERPCHHK